MAVLDIITVPDLLLRKVSEPVCEINDEVLNTLDDMLATMYDAPGYGLAAIQVGVARRLVVIDIQCQEEGENEGSQTSQTSARVTDNIDDPEPLDITPDHVASGDSGDNVSNSATTAASDDFISFTQGPLCFVNPEITWLSSQKSTFTEGCLSIPDYTDEVVRPARCRVSYLDREGVKREIAAEGLLATCLQHEIDHLNGVLFIDHLSRLKREMFTRKLRKQNA